MDAAQGSDSMKWIFSDKMIDIHSLRLKKEALKARMNKTHSHDNNTNQNNIYSNSNIIKDQSTKRKNPFAKSEPNKRLKNISSSDLDASSDATLFELLNSIPSSINKLSSLKKTSFENMFEKLVSSNHTPDCDSEESNGEKHMPIDWTLHKKIRLMSDKPFPWSVKLKTSEEASSTTGFVRCLNIGEKETTLDTTPNARFHRHCLVWQHPSLPWLELYPRVVEKTISSVDNNSYIAGNQTIKDALYKEWSESFRSLFHLLRARQCPYFYVCANSFTALFRAAGICGLSELHALLTPTTRGFRRALKQEEIEFKMPLRKKIQLQPGVIDSCLGKAKFLSNNISHIPDQKEQFDDEDELEDKWLASLGVDESDIRKIHNLQTRLAIEKECATDNEELSLIFVIGVEAQALFNFLINCKSATTTVGTMAGIPPTLLSPVAFNGSTLKSLKIRENEVIIDSKKFYSLELKGALMPHVMPSLCSLMQSSERKNFSVTCAQLNSTTSFSKAKHGLGEMESKKSEKCPPSVFELENLSDCGLSKELLEHFCSPDPEKIQNVEHLKFSNDLYSWT